MKKPGGLFPNEGKAEGVWTTEGEAAQVKGVLSIYTFLFLIFWRHSESCML